MSKSPKSIKQLSTSQLPNFSWALGADIWNSMMERDSAYAKLKHVNMLDLHPSLVPSMRTILFDWLSQASAECRFYRETYHLAVDYTDRFLSAQINIDKLDLQLVGVTCLFIAAKYEEIHPPLVEELADLTSGAYTAEEIIHQETIILDSINWDLTPVTPNNWLSVYMKILITLDSDFEERKNDSFMFPTRNGIAISNQKRIACVIDLAILNIQSLQYSSSILAASAMSFFTDERTLRLCTGYKLKQLLECTRWLRPYVEAVRDIKEPVFVNNEESEKMHIYIATEEMLKQVEQSVASQQSRKRKQSSKSSFSDGEEIDDDADNSKPLKKLKSDKWIPYTSHS